MAEIHLVKGMRESADIGRPVVLQEDSISASAFIELADNVVEQIKLRNENVSPTQSVKITNMDGCST